jgi:hypothetical protein
MKLPIRTMKYVFYFIASITFLMLTPHKFTILTFIKDIVFCFGLYWLFDSIADQITYTIQIRAIEKEMEKQLATFKSKINDRLFTTTK